MDALFGQLVSAIQEVLVKIDTVEEKRSHESVAKPSPPLVTSSDAACQTSETIAPQKPARSHKKKSSASPKSTGQKKPRKPVSALRRSCIRTRQLLTRKAKTVISKAKVTSNEAAEPSEAKKRPDTPILAKSVPKKLKLLIPEDDVDDYAPYLIGKEATTCLF